ncbi:MAG: spermidine synthase [Thermodesulfobacteriota bacterium]|nr:spermidine synthase [Thermodesulfobacteriota bacterium]
MNLKRLIIWSIIGTGISSVTTQLLTIREFLTQFSGNEITISLVMFCWLVMTGMGAFAAKFLKGGGERAYALLILIIALWPLIQTIGIREFREVLFTHGVSPGFYPILLYILIGIAPYCLLTGFILPYSQYVLNRAQYPFETGDLYVTDSIGDIAGGAIFSFILVYWLKPFLIIAVTSSLLILIALLLLLCRRRRLLLAVGMMVCSVFYVFSAHHRFETSTLTQQYGNIVRHIESPYGRIVITREGPQYTFWESGLPLYSDANTIDAEEKVHYPLSQIRRPECLLLISGGLGQTLKEVSKHRPAHVDYVELDPALTGAADELGLIEKSPSLRIINTDARRYMKKTTRQYDAILIDLPDPDTFQLNRFFTDEFFMLAKRVLKKGGVLCLHLDYSPNYLSEIRRKKLSTLYNTAQMRFQYVLILPGEQAYFLLSDAELDPDIPSLLKVKGIPTSYIEGFFYGNVTGDRMKQLQDRLDRHEPLNTDFEPRLMNIVFQEWFIRHGAHPGWFFAALLGLTLLYMVFMKRAEYILFSTGFAAMGMEMLLIFAFQVIYGYIYLQIGAVVTAFLLGLLPGAMAGRRWRSRLRLQIMGSETAILSLLVIFFLWVSYVKTEPHPLHFLLFCFVFSFFSGFQFPVAAEIIGEETSPASGCLAADLCGAAVGTLATGTVLIPLWGIWAAAFFLILVKISSMIVFISGRRIRS